MPNEAVQPRLIYLATPYSHEDAAVRKLRFLRACDAAAHLIGQGYMVYSPIAHTHPIAVRHDLPLDFGFWRAFDERMIAACDEVVVYQIDGWAESRGVQAEIEIAVRLGKGLAYMAPLKDVTHAD